MRGLWLGVLFLCASTGVAGDRGFDSLVRDIENTYQAERLKIPLFGLVKAAMWVAKPVGVSGMELAIFEDIEVPFGREDRFLALVQGGLDTGWHPMVRIYSPRKEEWVTIFAKPEGKQMNLLLAVYEPGEAVLIQMKVKPKTLSRWLQRPLSIAGRMRGEAN